MVLLKTSKEVDCIKKSCSIVAYVLRNLYANIEPGISTIDLNNFAEELCLSKGGLPAFKGYKGFPFSICSSVNYEVVHGFPSNRILKVGDIISIDFGAIYEGWYGDAAFTKAVGKISSAAEKIIKINRTCLYEGIKKAVCNNRLGDIGNAIQNTAANNRFNIVPKFVGHGIGRKLHEEPQVLNYGDKGTGLLLKHGMVIAIEPILVEGSNETYLLPNSWTAITKDMRISAHWEHTIAILDSGTEILTKWD